MNDSAKFCPLFRPNEKELKTIEQDVAEVSDIQKTLLDRDKHLHRTDRVAHQYQIAGGIVSFTVTDDLPSELDGVGLFERGARYLGIARLSTGLGTPHLETNPDFLGARLAFQTRRGERVDFLALNDPAAPTDSHRDFVSVLYATGESAGAELPLVGDWGAYDAGNLAAEQLEFGKALVKRLGLLHAGKTLAHIVKQTLRTFLSSTAYQQYWTGVVEINAMVGKFTLMPSKDENRRPGLRPGERHLSEEWKRRQASGDVEFRLYWIPYLNEDKTSVKRLTAPWEESHKKFVGTVVFPKTDTNSEDAKLWAILASEMGANPGNWVRDRANAIKEPATDFETARKFAYRLSQAGRGVLPEAQYQSVFASGKIDAALAQELKKRFDEKKKLGHIDCAPSG